MIGRTGRFGQSMARRAFASGPISAREPAPAQTVHLGDEGVTDGDNLDPYLDTFWHPGTHLVVPAGSYTMSQGNLAILADRDAWFEGEGQVVLENVGFPGNMEAEFDAHLRIENVTVRGVDATGSNLWATAYDDAVVDFVNFNRPDGSADDASTTGLYLPAAHGGLTRFINCTIREFAAIGVSATSFWSGDANADLGTVEIWGGLYENNGVNNIQIAGDDARIMNATILWNQSANHTQSGDNITINEPGENILIEGCDIVTRAGGAGFDAIEIRPDKFTGPAGASAHLQDCRIRQEKTDSEIINVAGTYSVSADDIHLTGGGDYDMEGSGPFTNVFVDSLADSPTLEKQTINPDSLDDPRPGPDPSVWDWYLEIDTFDDPRSGVVYEFTVEGDVAAGASAEVSQNDSLVDNGDGTFTFTGETGGGFIDDWYFNGSVLSGSVTTHPDETDGSHVLRLNGQVVSMQELIDMTSPDGGDGDNGDGTNGDGSNGDGTNGDGSNGDGTNGDDEPQQAGIPLIALVAAGGIALLVISRSGGQS